MDIKNELNEIEKNINILGSQVKYNIINEDDVENILKKLEEYESKKVELNKKWDKYQLKQAKIKDEEKKQLEELTSIKNLNVDFDLGKSKKEIIENHEEYLKYYNEKKKLIEPHLEYDLILAKNDTIPYYQRYFQKQSIPFRDFYLKYI